MTYIDMISGKTIAQIREIDRALLGPEGEKPEAIGAANKAAMEALSTAVGGPVGRRKSKGSS